MTCFRNAARAATIGLFAVLGARQAVSQDRPAVFQHGVLANGTTWNATSSFLREHLRLTPVLTTTDWTTFEETQADQVASQASAFPGRLPFVGHSNGGIVSREFARRHAGRSQGIITIGTPHRGAPIANNWADGDIREDAVDLMYAIADPVNFYWIHDWDIGIPGPVFWIAEEFVNFFYNLLSFICPSIGICVTGASYALVPMAAQLASDYHPYISLLNGTANLTHEAQTLDGDSRIGLRTEFQPWNTVCYLLMANPANCIVGRSAAIILYLEAYQRYSDHEDWFLAENAYRWLHGASALIDIDAAWQSWIGALVYYRRIIDPDYGFAATDMMVIRSDGTIPEPVSDYPGGTFSEYVAGNIAHTSQTTNSAVRLRLRDHLLLNFEISARPPGSTAEVRVSPTSASVARGSTTQLVATAYDGAGNTLSGKTFVWTSDNPSIASVSSSGLVTGTGVGTTVVRASVDGYSAGSTITVTYGCTQNCW